ncbi:ThiF family adenylyltransferase [Streptomyces sp. NPDC004126]|uniref:ThiF family adenylyltransferase n=1 Tax=Streptomyces sp. NPDC004126 TaxID=3390695 RepID=UPI003D03A0AC
MDVPAHWANEVCSRLRVSWVAAGYNGPLVAVGTYGPDGPCYLCVAAGEEARLKPGAHPRMGGKGALAPVAGSSGQLIAYQVIALLTGIGREPLGYVRGMNLMAPDQHVHVRRPARPDCPVCAR